MPSVVVKNPTLLHEDDEQGQRCFPKPTITLDAFAYLQL